jgi:hypothetical protein
MHVSGYNLSFVSIETDTVNPWLNHMKDLWNVYTDYSLISNSI